MRLIRKAGIFSLGFCRSACDRSPLPRHLRTDKPVWQLLTGSKSYGISAVTQQDCKCCNVQCCTLEQASCGLESK